MRPRRLRTLWSRLDWEILYRGYLSTYLCLISECLTLHLFKFFQIFSRGTMTLDYFFLNAFSLFFYFLSLLGLINRKLTDELYLLALYKSCDFCLARVHFPDYLRNNRLRLFFNLDDSGVWIIWDYIVSFNVDNTIIILFFICTSATAPVSPIVVHQLYYMLLI